MVSDILDGATEVDLGEKKDEPVGSKQEKKGKKKK